MSRENLVLTLVPRVDTADPPLPLLTRARLLIYPYLYRGPCREHGEDAEGEARCECTPFYGASLGYLDSFWHGCLWRDRLGWLPASHPVADPEDEPRLAARVDLRNPLLEVSAIITPDGVLHFLHERTGPPGSPPRGLGGQEHLLARHADCMAVPFSCG